jgi:hypothetical protein
MSLRTGQQLNRTAWTVLPMPDGVINTVHQLAKIDIIGIPFHNRKRQEFAEDDPIPDHPSTGVINENENEEQTDEQDKDEQDEDDNDDEDDDNDDDDDDIDDDMPGLQERALYDSDSDDEDDEEDDGNDDDQSAGVLDDESTGVEVETVEEEDKDDAQEVPSVRTRGVPTANTTTRTSRRVKHTHLNSDFVYANYSSSLTAFKL